MRLPIIRILCGSAAFRPGHVASGKATVRAKRVCLPIMLMCDDSPSHPQQPCSSWHGRPPHPSIVAKANAVSKNPSFRGKRPISRSPPGINLCHANVFDANLLTKLSHFLGQNAADAKTEASDYQHASNAYTGNVLFDTPEKLAVFEASGRWHATLDGLRKAMALRGTIGDIGRRLTTAQGVDLCFTAYRPGAHKAAGLEARACMP